MGMQLPEWARTTFLVATGDGWPEADEDALRALAGEWSGIADAIALLEQRLDEPILAGQRAGWDGPAAESFDGATLALSGRGSRRVTVLAQGSKDLSSFIEDTSTNVEYMKMIVLGQLVIMAGQIAYLTAMSWVTFGASTAAIPALQAAGRAFAVTAVRQLMVSIAMGQVLQVGLDAAIQALQKFALHTRRDWNTDLTSSAAITGAVGGALGPAMGVLGAVASKAIVPMVGKKIAGAVEQIGVSAVHEYSTAMGTGMVTGQGFIGTPWDLTAGATDGATDAAGRLLRRRRGGTDLTTNTDITMPTTGSVAPTGDTGTDTGPATTSTASPTRSTTTQHTVAISPQHSEATSPQHSEATSPQHTGDSSIPRTALTQATGDHPAAPITPDTADEAGIGLVDQPSTSSGTAANPDTTPVTREAAPAITEPDPTAPTADAIVSAREVPSGLSGHSSAAPFTDRQSTMEGFRSKSVDSGERVGRRVVVDPSIFFLERFGSPASSVSTGAASPRGTRTTVTPDIAQALLLYWDQFLDGDSVMIDGQLIDLAKLEDVDAIVDEIHSQPAEDRRYTLDRLGRRPRELHDQLIALQQEADPNTGRNPADDLAHLRTLQEQIVGLEREIAGIEGDTQLPSLVRKLESEDVRTNLEEIQGRLEEIQNRVESHNARVQLLRAEVEAVNRILNGLIQPVLSAQQLTFVRMGPGRDSLWTSLVVAADGQIRATLGSAYLGPRPFAVTLYPQLLRNFVADQMHSSHRSAELVARVRTGETENDTGTLIEFIANEFQLSMTVVDLSQDVAVGQHTFGPEDGHPAYLIREGDDFSTAIPDNTIDRLNTSLAAYSERLSGFIQVAELDEFSGLDAAARGRRDSLVGATGVVSGQALLELHGLLRTMTVLADLVHGPAGPNAGTQANVEDQARQMAEVRADFDALVARLTDEGRQQRLRQQAATLMHEFDRLRSQADGDPNSAAFHEAYGVVRKVLKLVTVLRRNEAAAAEQAATPTGEFGGSSAPPTGPTRRSGDPTQRTDAFAPATPTVADQTTPRRNGQIRLDGRRRDLRVHAETPDGDPTAPAGSLPMKPSPTKPSVTKPSIADRLRGLGAQAVPVPDPRLFALPHWAELDRAWRGRTTAQPPDLEQEHEFLATGYSADALTTEQAAALQPGQVISLDHEANLVPQQSDLPPDSPVVIEIQGHVTATSLGVVVRPGRQYDVVSVRQEEAISAQQDGQGRTFVQLHERAM